MGDFTLGCLLGAPDGAQSFDVASTGGVTDVQSWAKTSATTSHFLVSSGDASFAGGGGTLTHSSQQGLEVRVHSSAAAPGADLLVYRYGVAEDAHARWFPEVTTHLVRVDLWWDAIGNVAGLNKVQLNLHGGGARPGYTNPTTLVPRFPDVPGLNHLRTLVAVQSVSDGRPRADFEYTGVQSIDFSLVLDDVLVQADPITLHPEYGFAAEARVRKAEHRTRAGFLHTYHWSRHGAWTVPLRYLSAAEAALLNWWWQTQRDLVFTLDTSDSEAMQIVRITNDTQPIGGKIRPYAYADEGWQGVLHLEAINDGRLVF